MADLWARVRLTIFRFTVIAVMTGPIKQKRAASGYELLKGDDEFVTTGRMPVGLVEGRSESIVGVTARPLAENEW